MTLWPKHCSVAERVYGTTLCFPAEFFHSIGSNTINQVTYVTRLKETMTQLRATPTCHHMRRRLLWAVICLIATTIPRSSHGHQMWNQGLHCWCQWQAGGNITGSSETSSHQRFGYYRSYSYRRYSLASFTGCTNSTAHNKDNLARTICPLAWLIPSMNVHVYWMHKWISCK